MQCDVNVLLYFYRREPADKFESIFKREMKEKIITAIIHLFPDDDWDGRQRIRTLSCRQLISPLKKKRRGKKD